MDNNNIITFLKKYSNKKIIYTLETLKWDNYITHLVKNDKYY